MNFVVKESETCNFFLVITIPAFISKQQKTQNRRIDPKFSYIMSFQSYIADFWALCFCRRKGCSVRSQIFLLTKNPRLVKFVLKIAIKCYYGVVLLSL